MGLALGLIAFGCSFVWIKILSPRPRWLYASYTWLVAAILQLMSAILFSSAWGNLLRSEYHRVVLNTVYGSGMRLYLTSIAITFSSSVLAMVIIRFRLPRPYSVRRDVIRKIAILNHAKVRFAFLILKSLHDKTTERSRKGNCSQT